MNPTQPSNLPPRLKERCFRVFELDISRIVAKFPEVVPLSPASLGYTPLTYSSRIRDAMASLYKFHWPTTLIDTFHFKEIYPDIKVSHRADGTIYAGGAKELKALDQQPEQYWSTGQFELPSPPVQAVEQTIHLTDAKEKQLMCLLASLRLFNQPVAVSGLSSTEIHLLKEGFDVEISEKEGKVFIL